MAELNPLRLSAVELRAAADAITERIRPLWQAGMTTNDIANALGMRKNQVVGKVHRSDMKPRPSPIGQGSWTAEEHATVRAMGYNHSAREIAAKIGRSVTSVNDMRKKLRRAGWQGKVFVAPRRVMPEVVIPEFRATVGGRIIPATSGGTSGRRMPLPVSVLPVVEVRAQPPSPHKTCQWPFGEPREKGFRFCGEAVVRGSYCAACAANAFARRAA